MNKIKFLKESTKYHNKNEFIGCLPKVIGKEELLNKLSTIFHFPAYFGYNWDALYDSLNDFNWINQKGIVLIHNEMPILDNKELKTYLEILNDSVQSSKKNEGHYFMVYFPEQSKEMIEEVLSPC